MATLCEGNDSLKGKIIAIIMQFNGGAFSAQYAAGVKEQVESSGGALQVQAAGKNLADMAFKLDAAVNSGHDEILTDRYGGSAGGWRMKGIAVVVSDVNLKVPA